MKATVSLTFVLCFTIRTTAWACGPFFADSLLDDPKASLAVPPVSYLHDLHEMAGTSVPESDRVSRDSISLMDQVPFETEELVAHWETEGLDAEEIKRRSERYRIVRIALLLPVTDVGFSDFPTHGDSKVDLPERPLGEDFPVDVADYVEAARLHANGQTKDARKLWKSILERPPEEKKLRALWAAWMLAKTSGNLEECLAWYARVEAEAELGGTDVLGLRAAAKAWRGPRLEDPIKAIHMLFEAFSEGRHIVAVDLRRRTSFLVSSKDQELLAAAAGDPLVRKLVNLDLYAALDGPRQSWIGESPDPLGFEGWFAALERQGSAGADGTARVAWALYASGKYDDSRRWLALAEKVDPLTLWLQAKFNLRDGDTDAAARNLAEAVRLRSGQPDWDPVNQYSEARWYDEAREIQSRRDGRLLAEEGVVSLAREDYVSSLDALSQAGYREDAAYIAENVVSTTSLIKYVRGKVHRQNADEDRDWKAGQRNSGVEPEVGNRLRWVLARRLNREKRFVEAFEFLPPALVPMQKRYMALDRARRSGRYEGEARAAIVWEQALMHRHHGAELFSTEAGPDGGARDWSFPMMNLTQARTREGGWTRDPGEWSRFISSKLPEHRAVPPVSTDEMNRARRFGVENQRRFHYRYEAADLAWEAGKSLPANHPLLARLYNTAGRWLASSDPEAADRFYQAMVRRCAGTEEGKAAEEKRWFPGGVVFLDSMVALPHEFRRNPKTEKAW